ncbi:MAG TPA: RNA polymerase sigma factor [Kiritimatiellia bacterium]|nr:RNA polymerase sigma factor [Lentisphaerota bacterium]HOU21310.1 RNA polymerase sigma factor [Kiritimatiellia bacterium]HPC19829.1 RNA polymerase sigma factor [Kiritimatiellia bacterium]
MPEAATGFQSVLHMSEHDNATDESLVQEAIRRVLAGDIEAFATIIQTYQRLLAADLARRLPTQDVQEVAQDTFVRAFRSLPAYRGDAPVRIWLLRIARHAAMDFWRKRYRRRDRLFTDLDESEQVRVEAVHQKRLAEHQADTAAQEETREWLETALQRLSPDDRAVITLVALEERTMEEAARQLGCGLSAVKVRAFRARRRLKAILEEVRPAKE